MLEKIMKDMNINVSNISFEGLLNEIDQKINKKYDSIISKFQNIWANNGDTIRYITFIFNLSLHYTGTGSTHTSITRSGKQNIFGLIDHGLKSLGRFYN